MVFVVGRLSLRQELFYSGCSRVMSNGFSVNESTVEMKSLKCVGEVHVYVLPKKR